ncbi:hypothetical protein BT63DRAFT_426801 [Microthyrium microscopicum]|uniref:Uncharacterized protein n=1 Tax=Microthyrium microscopicum TaxID=703497 RepID=A0A6A6U6Z7_9PEZI|nr:hypothetical protein BT63DRAFT_426801 [Microthyrium microscopicum]
MYHYMRKPYPLFPFSLLVISALYGATIIYFVCLWNNSERWSVWLAPVMVEGKRRARGGQ